MNTRRGITRKYTRYHELFDPILQFRPNELYIITNEDNSLAITIDPSDNSVFLSPTDKNNKYQWVMLDSDLGSIIFFSDINNYPNVELTKDKSIFNRGDQVNTLFKFNHDYTIELKSNSNYVLGYSNQGEKTLLEAVRKNNTDNYSIKWKYVKVNDLRTLTDNVDTINELRKIQSSSNDEVAALQGLVKTNKDICNVETSYRDNIINGYEKNWFLRLFFK